jgi:hypothetical protein
VKYYLFVAYDDGMAGVGPTLIPDDDIGKFAQYVNDLPFALVAPLETYGHYIRHELVPPSARKNAYLRGTIIMLFLREVKQNGVLILLDFYPAGSGEWKSTPDE